jgi:multiple sugar transport system substrate-binding protein
MEVIDRTARRETESGGSHSRRRMLGLAAGVAAAAGGVALAACGAAPVGTAGSASTLPVEVVWTIYTSNELAVKREQEQHDLFVQEFPTITVTILRLDNSTYQDKLVSSLAAGSALDVFKDGPYEGVLPLVKQGHIEQLDPLLSKSKGGWWGTKDVKPTVMDWGKYKGKQYGFPHGTAAQYDFAINRNLYRTVGLADPPTKYDDPTWTFDRVLEECNKLTRRGGAGPEQFGINNTMSWNTLQALVTSWGGDFMDYKTGEFRFHEAPASDAIQWMADLVLKHHVAPSAAENQGGVLNFEKGHTGLQWSSFSTAMYLLSTVGDQFEWDMVPPPHLANKPPKLWFYTSWWVLDKATTAKDAAWTFIYWLGGPKGQRVETEYAWTAPQFFSLDSKFGLRMGPAGAKKNIAVATDFLKYVSPDSPQMNLHFSEAIRVLNPALAKVGSGELTAKEAMTQVKPQMDALLKQGVAEDK